MMLENLKEKTYRVRVVKGERHGENVLRVNGYSLIFLHERKSENHRSLAILIEPFVIEELKRVAHEEGMSLGDYLLKIVKDDNIPLVDIPREKGIKRKRQKKKAGISFRKEAFEELQRLKGSLNLHRFVVQKLYGWYFSRIRA